MSPNKLYTVFTLLLLSLPIQAQQTINSGHWYQIESKKLQQQRRYAVSLPASYQQKPQQTYPVIYLLDGSDSKHKSFTGVLEFMGSHNIGGVMPEAIIVSIQHQDRASELLPVKADLTYQGQLLAKLDNSGHADKFIDFIQFELLPHIRKNYRTNDQNLLVGHSFAGVTTAHIMLTQPQLFSHYLIIDATFIWHDNYLNKLAKTKANKMAGSPVRGFIAFANNDHLGPMGVSNRQWGQNFVSWLKQHGPSSLQLEAKYFAHEQHASVELQAWYHGLNYLFRQ